MSRGLKTYLPIWAVLCAIVNVIIWVTSFEHNSLFYTAYGFIMGSLVLQLIIYLLVSKKHKDIRIPAVVFSVIGTVLTIIVSFICLFLKLQKWLIILGAIIIGLTIVIVLLSNNTRERTMERDKKLN